uniref:Uncharacterized protein n=1 Tax=Amphimedon queenslandica TaxID=400682 RepID=A0A1X7TKS7_AMPQE
MSTSILFCIIINKTHLRCYTSWGVPDSLVIEKHVSMAALDSIQSSVTEAAGILGYTSHKSEQQYIIIEFLQGRDVFAV